MRHETPQVAAYGLDLPERSPPVWTGKVLAHTDNGCYKVVDAPVFLLANQIGLARHYAGIGPSRR